MSEEELAALVAVAGGDDARGNPRLPNLWDVRPSVVREGEHVYRVPQSGGDGRDGRGNGRPGPSPRRARSAKAVGDRAEAIVAEHLRRTLPPEQAATVRWVAAEGETPGWDVEYVGADGELEAVEVKETVGEAFASVSLASTSRAKSVTSRTSAARTGS